jgi:predicted metalloprotease
MRWQLGRRSDNVEDQRGGARAGGRRPVAGARNLSLAGVVIAIVVSLVMGKSPTEILSLLTEGGGSSAPAPGPGIDDTGKDFVRAILGDTEDVWGKLFQAAGKTYEQPKLILFGDAVESACGGATSATGPFYCPGDHQVYLDTSFFADMKRQLGGGGDFAEAYVIAHEVGHHVQTLLGVSAKVNAARRNGENVEGDGGLLVRQELQADCYAGVWGHHAQKRHAWLEPGDIEEAMNTATAIGDDRLQKQSRGRVNPDAFTHGTSQQRVRWFKVGFEKGEIAACDTFAVQGL